MAFVTYILWGGVSIGMLPEAFNFDKFMYLYSSSMFVWVLEVIAQKGFFFFLNIGKCSFCDITAMTGYKFVILSPIVASEILIGYGYSYFVMLVLGAVYALFFLKTLSRFGSHSSL